MKPQISDKIDVEKVSKTLGIKWEHQSMMDECFGEPEEIVFENTYLYTLLKTDSVRIRLFILSDLLNEVKILFNIKDSWEETIRFQNITKILYNPKLRMIIFESKNSDTYSQLRVVHDGGFNLSTSNPISNYDNSWLTFMAENLGLIEYKPEYELKND